MDGPDGGDTTISDSEGNVLLRARGGQGARVGSGVRSVSDKFAVSALMLANHTEIIGAYLSLLSAGFSHYNILNLNDRLTFTGAIVFEGSRAAEGEYAFTIQAQAPDSTIASSFTPVFRIIKTGDIIRMIFQFSMSVQVKAFGMWTIIVRHNDRKLAHLPIAIQQGLSGKTTPPTE